MKIPEKFKYFTVFGVAILILIALMNVSCDETSEEAKGVPYDPSKPLGVISFSPDSGRIRSRVILEGSNFGTDPEQIRVYFNNRRASVVGSSGDRMYVITPRMAANIDCDISIAMGNDSVVFPGKFRYTMSVSVSTIVGNGTNTTVAGPIETATISPWMVEVDAFGNIFAATDPTMAENQSGVVRINEEERTMEIIAITGGSNDWASRCYSLSIDNNTNVIYTTIGEAIQTWVYFDPVESWTPRTKTFTWIENPDHPEFSPPSGDIGGKYFGYNQNDGFLYTRYRTGHIARIDPVANTGMVLFITPEGMALGANYGETQSYAFDPKDPDWCYVGGNGGETRSGLYRFNVKDVANTWERLNHNSAPGEPPNTMEGHRDGPIEQALFRNVWGVRFDSNGYLYMCDMNNHCIRRYNPETRMVETMLGFPGQPGFKDGGPEDAQFNTPSWLAIDPEGSVYIADRNNRRIRRLAVE